jgi:4-amino-4-deoxy-L-arabinose transferase-like glycosyltransferase
LFTLAEQDRQPPSATIAERRAPSTWFMRASLGAILAAALGLRLWGLDWSLPWPIHPDERTPVEQARTMVETGDLNPRYFKNPSVFTYLLAGELLVIRPLGSLAGPLAYDVPGSAHLLARLNSALIGTASVGLIYLLGANVLGRRAGLLASLFLALSFVHVRGSHFGVNDVAAVGVLLISLLYTARLLQRPALRWYVLAGLAGGLATSTKYSVGFFFVPIVAAHLLAPHAAGQRPWGAAGLFALGLAGAAGLAGYLIGTPYALLDFGSFWPEFSEVHGYGERRWLGQPADPVSWLYLTSLAQGFGVLPLGLAGLGLVLAFWRPPAGTRGPSRGAHAVLLAFPLAYLAFLLPKDIFWPRLTIPLVPFCALLAAYGTLQIVELWPKLGFVGRPGLVAAILVAALAQPALNDVRHNRLLLQTNTRVLATEWALANLPPGSRVKAEFRSIMQQSTEGVPYPPNAPQLDIEYFEGRPQFDDAANFARRGVQYFVTSSHAYERLLLDPPLKRQRETGKRYLSLHRDLDREATLLARFAPGHGGRSVPYSQDEIFTPFWNLDQYDRPGPTIQIYALGRPRTARDRER